MSTEKNIIDTVIEAIRAGMIFETSYENGTPFLLAPDNFKLHQLDQLRELPIRTEQQTRHTTAQSFIDYYNHYATNESAIFIDEIDNRFIAVLDFHAAEYANWKKHISTFELKQTPEWSAWKSSDKKQMTQEQFAEFIESNLLEIITPPGADMLEIAHSIQAKSSVKFSKSIRLDNGQTQLQYHEVIDGTAGAAGQLKIPEKFTIGLKLFRGGAPYQMDARLRYRIKDGNLALWYELIRQQTVIDANINDTTQLIEQSVGIGKIYRGMGI